MIQFFTGDVLDAQADALILTIDGASAGLEGNIARQFAKRWPIDFQDMEKTLPYPIPIGRTVGLEWEGDAPWRLFLFASTLHHVEVLTDHQKQAVVQRAFAEALQVAARYGARVVSTPLLQGGWRLSTEYARSAMLSPAAIALAERHSISVRIWVLPAEVKPA